MKKFKKLSALLLAVIMTLAMAVPAMAADLNPDDTTTIAVEAQDATSVTGFQILKVKKNETTGFFEGYEAALVSEENLEGDALTAAQTYNAAVSAAAVKLTTTPIPVTPDEADISAIVKAYKDLATKPADITFADADEDGVWEATVGGGSYITLIKGSEKDIYNPVLLSASFNSANELEQADSLIADSATYGENGKAKKTTITFDKGHAQHEDKDGGAEGKVNDSQNTPGVSTDAADLITGHIYKIGETVPFNIKTQIPNYAEGAYKTITYYIQDSIEKSSFDIDQTSIKVFVDGDELTGDEAAAAFTLKVNKDDTTAAAENAIKTAGKFVVDFKSDFIKQHLGEEVQVTYSATLLNTANLATAAGDNVNVNEAKVVFSNNPKDESDKDELEDETYTYTFTLKVRKVDEKNQPLAGAKFGIYSDAEATTLVTGIPQNQVTSGNDGTMTFTGLKEGNYYLKEIEAPTVNGVKYSLNENIYRVELCDSTYDSEGKLTGYMVKGDLGEYKVNVSYTGEGKDAVASVTYEKGEDDDLVDAYVGDIPNTPLTSLPSTGGIGTYIFTIAGVAILAIAAFLLIFKRRKVEE